LVGWASVCCPPSSAEKLYVYNHSCNDIGKINLERLKYIPQGGSWRNIPFELLPAGLKRARKSDHTKRYGRLHSNALCSTILTKFHIGVVFSIQHRIELSL